ncbi:MAG TPA: formylglycine-generating enzyme family protein [Candidatus Krumholzibacteria bacterium]|nr:formylglycine-generating enzyme family protein [Candidatus Krumholzibacteria bacterium]
MEVRIVRSRRLAAPALILPAFILMAFILAGPGCTDDPTALTLEDYGIHPGLQLADGAPSVPANIVTLQLTGAGADSCVVWNSTDQGNVAHQAFPLDAATPLRVTWTLEPGEGLKIVQARFYGHGGAASQVCADSVVVDQTPPEPGAARFPPGGAEPVGTTVRFAWSPFVDAVSDSQHVVYQLAVHTGDRDWLVDCGAATEGIVVDLPRASAVTWSVAAVDGAGNRRELACPAFTTWDLALPAFVAIEAGTFMMGSPESEPGHQSYETLHQVTLTHGFAIGATQVTYGTVIPLMQWAFDHGLVTVDASFVRDAVGGDGDIVWRFEFSIIQFDGSSFSFVPPYGNYAAICRELTWYGAAALCDWLNAAGGFDLVHDRSNGWAAHGDIYAVHGFRLPTEAEWEYACRAGSSTAFWNGDLAEDCPCPGWPCNCCSDAVLGAVGWYCANYSGWDAEPARKPANPWGLFDVHGGAGDWCYDTANGIAYGAGAVVDPVDWENPGSHCVRGRASGSIVDAYPPRCRAASRGGGNAPMAPICGFRLVLSGIADVAR